jgi:L-alanine-DL-glutamate epimerase-like enolase superfamily enzyme
MWPGGECSLEQRRQAARVLAAEIASRLPETLRAAHPLEIATAFMEGELPLLARMTAGRIGAVELPESFARGVFSAFDTALHDAYGKVNDIPAFAACSEQFMRRDLRRFLGYDPEFTDRYPADYLRSRPLKRIDAWHLVGGDDPLDETELTEAHPRDRHPLLLRDWIRSDGLRQLKIKLCGIAPEADLERLRRIGEIAREEGVEKLAVDFNCTVSDPQYLRELLEALQRDRRELFDMLAFVEQPFAADLVSSGFDVRDLAAVKPLILDESALEWKSVRLGAGLGWSGAALKSCKSVSGMLIAYSWLRSRGLQVLVHDLTNPMLAQLVHLQMAAHFHTAAGVETNSMQFYPEASAAEARVHPGAYLRRGGQVDISSLRGSGYGYRIDEIDRSLPEPELVVGTGWGWDG